MGMTTWVMALQPQKVSSLISETPLGMVTSVIFRQP